ncbi:hypothetical protein THASP1DRAFT_32774, partial [Thamnocephalis sphaerospora]
MLDSLKLRCISALASLPARRLFEQGLSELPTHLIHLLLERLGPLQLLVLDELLEQTTRYEASFAEGHADGHAKGTMSPLGSALLSQRESVQQLTRSFWSRHSAKVGVLLYRLEHSPHGASDAHHAMFAEVTALFQPLINTPYEQTPQDHANTWKWWNCWEAVPFVVSSAAECATSTPGDPIDYTLFDADDGISPAQHLLRTILGHVHSINISPTSDIPHVALTAPYLRRLYRVDIINPSPWNGKVSSSFLSIWSRLQHKDPHVSMHFTQENAEQGHSDAVLQTLRLATLNSSTKRAHGPLVESLSLNASASMVAPDALPHASLSVRTCHINQLNAEAAPTILQALNGDTLEELDLVNVYPTPALCSDLRQLGIYWNAHVQHASRIIQVDQALMARDAACNMIEAIGEAGSALGALTLVGAPLTDPVFATLVSVLPRWTHLRRLELSLWNMDATAGATFMSELARLPMLEELCLTVLTAHVMHSTALHHPLNS